MVMKYRSAASSPGWTARDPPEPRREAGVVKGTRFDVLEEGAGIVYKGKSSPPRQSRGPDGSPFRRAPNSPARR
jgi:hypothetical protein